MGTLKLNNVTAITESGGTVTVDSAVAGIPAAGITGTIASGVTIPAAGVTGTLPNAVTDNITTIGTVTTGSLEGTAWRRFNGLMRYTADSCHDTTTCHWENKPAEGSLSGRDGFLRNPDSCMTHTDSTQTITINSAGYYFVYATMIPITSATNQSSYIRKNGVKQCDNRSGGNNSHGNAVSCVVLNMAVNDTIDVVTETNIHKGPYGNIVIFKIGE